MNSTAIETAAGILADLRLRTNGQDRQLSDLPDACRPQTLDEAYQIQTLLRQRLAERGLGPPVGWKIGCTTAVMQKYLNISHPCAGTLYQHGLYSESVTLDTAAFFRLGLECELAVRLAADIPPRAGGHTIASVAAAVASVMTSVEIVDERFQDFRTTATTSLIADDFFSAGCVLGEEVTLADVGDLAALVGGFRLSGGPPDQQGKGAAIMGHPLQALAWLADHLCAQGSSLKKAEVVTLGSVVKTIYPVKSANIEARFDKLSPVFIELQAPPL